MNEIRIHGSGGQGGVTLAKLIATTRYLLGESVQAFGIYAAERSGVGTKTLDMALQRFTRLEVPGSPVVGGVWVSVTPEANEPFSIDLLYPDAHAPIVE